MAFKEGVPTLKMDKMLDRERAKAAAMPQDDDVPNSLGLIRFPREPTATFMPGVAQRNVPALLRTIQEEMTESQRKSMRRASLKAGQGKNIALGAGMRTAPLHQQIAFDSIFG